MCLQKDVSERRPTHIADKTHERFTPCWQAYSNNHDTAGMEKSARFCAVKLRRCHLNLLGKVMDGVDESTRLSPKPRRVGNNICSPDGGQKLFDLSTAILSRLKVLCEDVHGSSLQQGIHG